MYELNVSLFTVLSFTVTANNGDVIPVSNVGVSNAPL